MWSPSGASSEYRLAFPISYRELGTPFRYLGPRINVDITWPLFISGYFRCSKFIDIRLNYYTVAAQGLKEGGAQNEEVAVHKTTSRQKCALFLQPPDVFGFSGSLSGMWGVLEGDCTALGFLLPGAWWTRRSLLVS